MSARGGRCAVHSEAILQHGNPETRPLARDRGHGLLLAGLALATLAAFWPTLRSFHPVWTSYTYSHGYVIGLLTVWLVWRHRDEFMAARGGWPLALLPLVGLSVLWLVATILNVRVVQQAVLPFLFASWGVAVFGLGSAKLLVPIGVTFLLAVPFWEALTPSLQIVTITVNEALLWVIRLPADVQGEIITIPAGSFEVAESCAGLIYLMVGLVVGVLYVHLFVRGWRTRLAILGLAAAVSLFSNWMRVFGLVVIGHATDMRSSLMTGHYTYGWVVFTIALVPFFVFARRIEGWGARAKDPARQHTGSPSTDAAVVTSADDGFDGWHGLWRSPQRLLARSVLASAIAVVGPISYFGYGTLPAATPARYELGDLANAGAWRSSGGLTERPFTWQPDFRGQAEQESVVLTDGEASVYVDHLVYRDQRQGAELIQFMNRIAPREMILEERVSGPVDSSGRFVREALVQTEQGPILVWYWYRVAGIDTSSPTLAKLLELVAFVRRYREAELIALSSPCGEDSCLNAFEALVTLFGGELPS